MEQLGPDLFVHPQRRQLVDGHDHRLALIAAVQEMVHDVLRHRVQPVVAGDQVIALAQHLPQLLLLILVQPGVLDRLVDLLVQLRVGDLQFRRPVLVEQRNRRPVLHRLPEIVDAHVIAEHPARPFFSRDQGRAGEGHELRVRQRRAHVHRQRVVLAAVRLVRQHDDVIPLRQHRMQGPRLRAELVDQREDVTVIRPQQLPQMAGARCLAMPARHRPAIREGLVNLPVQFRPVRDHHEGPVPLHLPEHLLREEDHRVTLPRPLRVPENPDAPVRARHQRRDRPVHPEILVIAGDQLGGRSLAIGEAAEILDQIQQPPFLTSPAQQRRQGDRRHLLLARRLLPIAEMLPLRGQAAELALHAVRDDQQRVVVEELRDRLLVVAEVLVEALAHVHAGLLQLDQHQRQAVHEAHQIRPLQIQLACHPELRGQQEIIVLRQLPIDHPHHLHPLTAVLRIGKLHLHALLQQLVDLPVRLCQAQRRAIPAQLLHRSLDRLHRQIRIQPLERRLQPNDFKDSFRWIRK